MKTLLHYLLPNQVDPFGEWLDSLKDRKARAKIFTRLDRLALGNPGDCKSIGAGLSELRIDFGPGYRVYFGQDGEILIILLCGGDKDSQDKDIIVAKEYWADYKRRKKK